MYVLQKPPLLALIDCKLFPFDVTSTEMTMLCVVPFDATSFTTASILFHDIQTYHLVALFAFKAVCCLLCLWRYMLQPQIPC